MHSVAAAVDAKASAEGVRSQVLCNLGVHRAAEVSECLHNVFLTDLEHDAWAVDHVIDNRRELGKNSLVDFKELLSSWLVHIE